MYSQVCNRQREWNSRLGGAGGGGQKLIVGGGGGGGGGGEKKTSGGGGGGCNSREGWKKLKILIAGARVGF